MQMHRVEDNDAEADYFHILSGYDVPRRFCSIYSGEEENRTICIETSQLWCVCDVVEITCLTTCVVYT